MENHQRLKQLLVVCLAVMVVVVMVSLAFCKKSHEDPESSSGNNTGKEVSTTEKTLESYFNEHEDELEKIKEEVNADESINRMLDVDIKVRSNTMYYYYTFKQRYPEEQLQSIKVGLEDSLKKLDDNMNSKIEDMEKGYNVEGVNIVMEYRNGDGSKICSRKYEKKTQKE